MTAPPSSSTVRQAGSRKDADRPASTPWVRGSTTRCNCAPAEIAEIALQQQIDGGGHVGGEIPGLQLGQGARLPEPEAASLAQ